MNESSTLQCLPRGHPLPHGQVAGGEGHGLPACMQHTRPRDMQCMPPPGALGRRLPLARPRVPAVPGVTRARSSHPPALGLSRARPRKWRRGRPDAAVAPLTFGSPAHLWLRDLTEEGIEPHPGPRFISKNINSIHGTGKLYLALRAIRNEANQNPITAVFIQDHRLPQKRAQELSRTAHNLQLAVVAAHAKPASNGACYGGTMIIVPYEALEPVTVQCKLKAVIKAGTVLLN